MLADWTLPEPFRCAETRMQMAVMWFSGGGTSSVLHKDPSQNMLCLLDGEKRLMLVAPREEPKLYASLAELGGTSPVHQEEVRAAARYRFIRFKLASRIAI